MAKAWLILEILGVSCLIVLAGIALMILIAAFVAVAEALVKKK